MKAAFSLPSNYTNNNGGESQPSQNDHPKGGGGSGGDTEQLEASGYKVFCLFFFFFETIADIKLYHMSWRRIAVLGNCLIRYGINTISL